MHPLSNKVVIISGAGSGIGRALALECAGYGAKLGICDINRTDLQETAKLARDRGACVLDFVLDVSQSEDYLDFAKDVLRHLGPADVLINNAGVSLISDIRSMARKDFEWLFSINFWGVVNGCSAFLPQLAQSEEAHIVNISSVFGLVAQPGQAAYAASKFAVRAYTDALRVELKSSKISVTVVHPGGVRTAIVRHGRHFTDGRGKQLPSNEAIETFDRLARTTPEQAAAAIIRGIVRKKSRVLIGLDAHLFDFLSRLMPARSASLIARIMERVTKSASAVLKGEGKPRTDKLAS